MKCKPMELKKTSCCHIETPAIHTKKTKYGGRWISFFSTALLILLPKCPFCVAAYTGAILMFFDVQSTALIPFSAHVKPILGILILGLLIVNYKGRKTQLAIGIAGVALVLLLLAHYKHIVWVPDWVVYLCFVFAVGYNGNMQHFYRFLKSKKPIVRTT